MIYAIGDSHVRCLGGRPDVIVQIIGSATAYQLARPSEYGKNLLEILAQLHPEDIALLSFGEIDCRNHIGYQEAKTGTPRVLLVGRTVVRYLNFVLEAKSLARKVILGVVPCGSRDNLYQVPNYLPRPERAAIYLQFNDQMVRVCGMVGLPYVNQMEQFGDSQGLPLPEFIADPAHLNEKTADWVVKTTLSLTDSRSWR